MVLKRVETSGAYNRKKVKMEYKMEKRYEVIKTTKKRNTMFKLMRK